MLCKKCSYFSLSKDEQIKIGFKDNEVIHLYISNKKVQEHNNKKIMDVGNPIVLVQAKNTSRAKSMNDNNF